jgi:hypothetical protein
MGMKYIGKTLADPLGSFIGFDKNPLIGGSKEEVQHPEGLSEEDKEYIRMARARQAATGKSATGYKRGGSVKRKAKAKTRGCGCASSGTRKAKMY